MKIYDTNTICHKNDIYHVGVTNIYMCNVYASNRKKIRRVEKFIKSDITEPQLKLDYVTLGMMLCFWYPS